ncbi:hypothetical protein GOZ89_06705 [Agrobacterium vitis]|uniref:diiron oxygenase n=1 Tax=Agrobacterium vitis TaxID=373 RepID=UPI0012E904AE|nr:diiron oxygenase [Agrobacterium vitis]MCF1470227.1 diiron oxygenase [Agrobacterium vitis]MVA79101.1 hypothetical protein [Agrobacterium vitis]
MCGIVGFFTGCKLAASCPKARKNRDYTSAFRYWDEKATVRQAARREIDPNDENFHLFPKRFAPVSEHPLILTKYPEKINTILGLHLVRYMKFTQMLELVVVNDATRSVALGQMPFDINREMLLDAHRLYCDEAYHALFSADIIEQVERLFGVASPNYVPSFLLQIRDTLASHDNERQKFLLKLIFVIVSEMLITSNLKDVHKGGEMPQAVSDVMRDHAADESRHHVFYRELLTQVWPQLSKQERLLWARHIPKFVSAFIDPDEHAITSELFMIGITKQDSQQILLDTYSGDNISSYKVQCATQLLRALEDLDIFHQAEYREIFLEAGYSV